MVRMAVIHQVKKMVSLNTYNTHIILLDTVKMDLLNLEYYIKWLEKDLSSNRKPWVAVFLHHPPYTKGSHDSDDDNDSKGILKTIREYLTPIFEKHNVDFVFAGHSHSYERSSLIKGHTGDSSTFNDNHIIKEGLGVYEKCKNGSGEGTIYSVIGSTANGRLEIKKIVSPYPSMEKSYETSGSAILRATSNELELSFVAFNGDILDNVKFKKVSCE